MTSVSKEVYLDWYKKMLLWRKFEEKAEFCIRLPNRVGKN